jgi:hypothetical protein
MPMDEFTRRPVQLLSYLEGDYLHQTMDVPMAQEKSEQIFFAQPKVHQNKFADLNKMVPTNPLMMIAFFEQCQATNKAAGILQKIAKDKKQPKEKKVAHLPAARSCESSYPQQQSHKYRNYHQSNWRNCDDCQPENCHQDKQHPDHGQRSNKDAKSNKSYDRKDDKHDISKKKSNKAMHNDNDQSSLSSSGSSSGTRSQSFSRSSLHSCSWSCSYSSSRSYDTHHVDQDDCKPSTAPKHGHLYSKDNDDGHYLYSKDNDDGHYHRPDKSNTILQTSPLWRQRKSAPRNRELRQ